MPVISLFFVIVVMVEFIVIIFWSSLSTISVELLLGLIIYIYIYIYSPILCTIFTVNLVLRSTKKNESFIIETPTKDIITQLGHVYIDNTPQITTNHPKCHLQNFTKI